MRKVQVLFVAMCVLVAASFASAQAKRLDYKQEQALKDARFYLDEVENYVQQLQERTANLTVGDPSVPIQKVESWVQYVAKCKQSLTNADTRLKQLPPEHAEVKTEIDRAATLNQSLAAVDTKVTELRNALKGVVEQGSGAEYKADFDRLKEINQMFGDPSILDRQPDAAIDVVKQIGPVKTERQRIAQKYAALLQQDTPQSRDMNGVLRHFDDVFGRFEQALNQYTAGGPAQINSNIDEALTMGRDAVENKKHLFFGENGGIAQRIGWAQTRLNVLAAISPDSPDVSAAKQKLESAKQQIEQMKQSLMEAIASSNQPPAEPYNAPDKAQLIELVKAKWAEAGAAGDVLKVGINSQSWQRSTRWEWDGTSTWNKVDKSKIQGFVIVKLDDKMAAIHHINLVKDHLGQDCIAAYFFNDPKQPPSVDAKLLVANVK